MVRSNTRVASTTRVAEAGRRPASSRFLVVSSTRLCAEGIARFLAAAGYGVVATAPDEASAVAAAGRLSPEVAIVDVAGADTRRWVHRIAGAASGIRMIAICVPDDVEAVVACAEAGTMAYVGCEHGETELLRAIESVLRDELYCSPRVATLLCRRLAARTVAHDGHTAPLTPRERQVLHLMDEGFSNKQIAAHLHLGLTTVKNHVHNILAKLNAHRRGEAVARARAAANDAPRSPR